MPLVDKRVGGR